MSKDGFTAQLIVALEEAQAAASKPKPAHLLAQAAYDKLQFDFPVVSEAELAALVDDFASGKRRGVTARFLAVLRENAGSGASTSGDAGSGITIAAPGAAGTGNAAASGPSSSRSSQGLVPLYQQLYAVAVLQTLQSCLAAPEAAAAAELAGLASAKASGCGSFFEAEGKSQLEAALATAVEEQGAAGDRSELEHRLSQQEDDDSSVYEPLEVAPPILQPAHQPAAQAVSRQAASAQPGSCSAAAGLPAQLADLAGHLSYQQMCDASAWRELRLMQRLAACLAAVRGHACLPDLAAVAQPILRLAVDRCVAAPAELEAGLPALLDALGAPSDGSSSSSSTTGSQAPTSQQGSTAASAAANAAAAELAIEAAVALAAQVTAPSARRRLWQATHQRLLSLAAQQLEQQQLQLARQARVASKQGGAAGRAQASAQQLYSIMLACQLLYFFVLEAPPGFAAPRGSSSSSSSGGGSSGSSRLQDAFLQGGLLRSLVLLFIQLGAQPGAEPLRCAVLLTCGAAPPLAEWAAAVPGFTAAVAAPELGPGSALQLHGALWRMLLGDSGNALAALLGDATPADKVPAVFQALQLMADVQAVARRPLWDDEVAAALRRLGDTLRQQYSKPRDEAAGAASGSNQAAGGAEDGSEGEAAVGWAAGHEDNADAAKLALGAEEQAARLATRRAQQLQPACLKLVKNLLQRGGGSGKHD